MGVPVVTLAGDTHAGRVGLALLRAAGLDDLIAADLPGYLLLTQRLAADRPRLANLRASLRPRLIASPLGDATAFAARFADALQAAVRS